MTGNRTADVAIIGAGAAGIGAALTLKRLGRSFIILEASHRIGGRGYTEEIVPGVPFDLGCHWLHSASINPLVKVADEFGISYSKQGYPRASFTEGRWNTPEETAEFEVFYDRQERRMQKVADGPGDCSIYEATEREHRWSGFFDYFTTLDTSHDADEVSVTDLMAYNDTEENWCLKEGYGTLLVRLGGSLPVTLNSAVSSVDWSGSGVKLETARGTVSATKALITVSTGMLSAGDIRFTPDLPDWKHEAVAALPLGNQNRICLAFDRDVFGPDIGSGFATDAVDGNPVSFYVRPFGFDYVVGLTGGRFADWLERAGQQAAIDYFEQKLRAVFGNSITRHRTGSIVTAWRGDPWVRGAYSAARPGCRPQRAKLAEPVDDRLYFAGEATSSEFYSTAHGAYLSGIAAAEAMV